MRHHLAVNSSWYSTCVHRSVCTVETVEYEGGIRRVGRYIDKHTNIESWQFVIYLCRPFPNAL